MGFLSTTAARLIGKPGAWGELVREASDIRPVIVFIDEADPVLLERRYSNVEVLANEILTSLSGAQGKARDVMYIAATNHYDRLDKAVLRGGRFEEKIRFDVPEREDMRLYANRKLANMTRNRYTVASACSIAASWCLTAGRLQTPTRLSQKQSILPPFAHCGGAVAQLRVSDVSVAARTVFAENVDTSATR
ncbi:AAA family ATPase [Paraburkholderia sp. GAS206C]|uniref:AAA family ATPase n=1 Tax=unclassified Paraburkholderia TaxID=2615204 RepID=UPI003D25C5AF